jgi:hypothetical protein
MQAHPVILLLFQFCLFVQLLHLVRFGYPLHSSPAHSDLIRDNAIYHERAAVSELSVYSHDKQNHGSLPHSYDYPQPRWEL